VQRIKGGAGRLFSLIGESAAALSGRFFRLHSGALS
jgi:hypothetical protein